MDAPALSKAGLQRPVQERRSPRNGPIVVVGRHAATRLADLGSRSASLPPRVGRLGGDGHRGRRASRRRGRPGQALAAGARVLGHRVHVGRAPTDLFEQRRQVALGVDEAAAGTEAAEAVVVVVLAELGPVLGVPLDRPELAAGVGVHAAGAEAAAALFLQVVAELGLVAAREHRGPPGGARGRTWVPGVQLGDGLLGHAPHQGHVLPQILAMPLAPLRHPHRHVRCV